MPPIRRSATQFPSCPDRHAKLIAERVGAAWSSGHGSGHVELPLSVVAALSLLSAHTVTPDEMVAGILRLATDDFAELIGELWLSFTRSRPDLVIRAWPLMSIWFDAERPPTEQQRRAAQSVGTAAIRADLSALTATERRQETDLLGTLLTHLKPKTVLQDRGQFLTPPAPCTLIAQILGDYDRPVFDPAAGRRACSGPRRSDCGRRTATQRGLVDRRRHRRDGDRLRGGQHRVVRLGRAGRAGRRRHVGR